MENAENPRLDHAIYVTDFGSVVVLAEPAQVHEDSDAPMEYADLAKKYARVVATMGPHHD